MEKYKQPVKLYFSHDNPIPDCFNIPLQQALDDGCNRVMILEEDVGLPKDALVKLMKSDTDLTAYDYYLRDGELMWQKRHKYWVIGTGAIMFKAETLKKLLPLRTTVVYNSTNLEEAGELSKENSYKHYGWHDIDMCIRAQRMKMTISCVGVAKHYKVVHIGDPIKNKGFHIIGEWGPEDEGKGADFPAEDWDALTPLARTPQKRKGYDVTRSADTWIISKDGQQVKSLSGEVTQQHINLAIDGLLGVNDGNAFHNNPNDNR